MQQEQSNTLPTGQQDAIWQEVKRLEIIAVQGLIAYCLHSSWLTCFANTGQVPADALILK